MIKYEIFVWALASHRVYSSRLVVGAHDFKRWKADGGTLEWLASTSPNIEVSAYIQILINM